MDRKRRQQIHDRHRFHGNSLSGRANRTALRSYAPRRAFPGIAAGRVRNRYELVATGFFETGPITPQAVAAAGTTKGCRAADTASNATATTVSSQ